MAGVGTGAGRRGGLFTLFTMLCKRGFARPKGAPAEDGRGRTPGPAAGDTAGPASSRTPSTAHPPGRDAMPISQPVAPAGSPRIRTKAGATRCRASTLHLSLKAAPGAVANRCCAKGCWPPPGCELGTGRPSNDDNLACRHKLRPGEGHVFDNHRLLHARTALNPAAACRHIQQASVDHEEFHSSYRRLAEKLGRMDDAAAILPGSALG